MSGTMLMGCHDFPITNGTPLKCEQDFEVVGVVVDETGHQVEIEVPIKKCHKKVCPDLLSCYDKEIKIQQVVQIPPNLKPELLLYSK